MVSNVLAKGPIMHAEEDWFHISLTRRSRAASDEPTLHELAAFRDPTNLQYFSDSEQTLRIGNETWRSSADNERLRSGLENLQDGQKSCNSSLLHSSSDEETESVARSESKKKRKKKGSKKPSNDDTSIKRSQSVPDDLDLMLSSIRRSEMILKETMRRLERGKKPTSKSRSRRHEHHCDDLPLLGDDDLLSVSTPKSSSSESSSDRRSRSVTRRRSKSKSAPSSPTSSPKPATRRRSSTTSRSLSPKPVSRRCSGRSSPKPSSSRRGSATKMSPIVRAVSPKPYVTSENSVPYVTSKSTIVKPSNSRRSRSDSVELSSPMDDSLAREPARRRANSQGELRIDLEDWDIEPASILRRSSTSSVNTSRQKKRVSFCMPDEGCDSDDFNNNRTYQEIQDDIDVVLDFL